MKVARTVVMVWLGVVACVPAMGAPANAREELTAMRLATKTRIPLLVRSLHKPGPAALVGNKLYFSLASAPSVLDCAGRDLYVYELPAAADAPAPAERQITTEGVNLSCVYALKAQGDRLLVQYKNASNQSGLAVVTGDRLDTRLPTLGATFRDQQADVFARANKRQMGAVFLYGQFLWRMLNPFAPGARFSFVFRAPQVIPQRPSDPIVLNGRMVMGYFSSTLEDAPRVLEMNVPTGTVHEVSAASNNDVLMTIARRQNSPTEHYSVIGHAAMVEATDRTLDLAFLGVQPSHFTVPAGADVEKSSWFGRIFRFLTATPKGGHLVAERSEEPGEVQRLWYFTPDAEVEGHEKAHQVRSISGRDVSGVGITESGAILISRSGSGSIEAYVDAAADLPNSAGWTRISTARVAATEGVRPASDCGNMIVKRSGTTKTEVGYMHLVREGEREYIPLAVFDNAPLPTRPGNAAALTAAEIDAHWREQWKCSPTEDSVLFLSKKAHLELMKDHLQLGLTAATPANTYASNADAAVRALVARNGVFHATERPAAARFRRESAVIENANTRLLFVLKGDRLGLVRAPGDGTQFASVVLTERRRAGQLLYDVYHTLINGDPVPQFKLEVRSDGQWARGPANDRIPETVQE